MNASHASRLVSLCVLALAALSLSGCVLWSTNYHQRTVLKFSTPSGPIEAEATLGAEYLYGIGLRLDFVPVWATDLNQWGEAHVVDFGEPGPGETRPRRLFVSYLGQVSLGPSIARFPLQISEERSLLKPEYRGRIEFPDMIDMFLDAGRLDLPDVPTKAWYPFCVAYDDEDDPTSIRWVDLYAEPDDPRSVESVFGEGYSYEGGYVEVSDGPATEGRIYEEWPFLKWSAEDWEPYSTPGPFTPNPELGVEMPNGSIRRFGPYDMRDIR